MLAFAFTRLVSTWFRDVVYSKRYEVEYFVMIKEIQTARGYECRTSRNYRSLCTIYTYNTLCS